MWGRAFSSGWSDDSLRGPWIGFEVWEGPFSSWRRPLPSGCAVATGGLLGLQLRLSGWNIPPTTLLRSFSLLLWQILSKSSRQYVTGLAICSWKYQCFAYQAFCFFPPVACNKITLRKQLNIGLWISTQAQIRQEPDVALKMLIMFVLFTNAAQSRFLHFLAFFPCWVYIHRRPFWHKLQTMRVLVLSYKRFCLLETALSAMVYSKYRVRLGLGKSIAMTLFYLSMINKMKLAFVTLYIIKSFTCCCPSVSGFGFI